MAVDLIPYNPQQHLQRTEETPPDCSICHDSEQTTQFIAHRTLSDTVFHYFHKTCLANWIEISKKRFCPLCKAIFSEKSLDEQKISWKKSLTQKVIDFAQSMLIPIAIADSMTYSRFPPFSLKSYKDSIIGSLTTIGLSIFNDKVLRLSPSPENTISFCNLALSASIPLSYHLSCLWQEEDDELAIIFRSMLTTWPFVISQGLSLMSFYGPPDFRVDWRITASSIVGVACKHFFPSHVEIPDSVSATIKSLFRT